MSARQRSARPSATPARSRPQPSSGASQSSVAFPEYKSPSAPLNTKAITELERLPARSRHTAAIKKLQAQAIDYLTNATTTVNEHAADRKSYAARLQTRVQRLEARSSQTQPSSQQDGGEGADNENENDIAELKRKALEEHQQEDSYVREFQRKTDEATERAEECLRSLIDTRAKMQARENALLEVSGNVVRGEGRVAPTQSTLGASQFRTQPNLDDDEDESGDRPATSVLDAVRMKVEAQDAKYQAMTKRAKYGQQNDYVGFKGMVHSAIHQDDGARLSHYSQWFPSEPGDDEDVQMQGTGTQEQDEDSDLEVAGEVISTKCPLSLTEMQDVLTSPCNHNFEAANIRGLISESQEREMTTDPQRRRGMALGARIVRCPVPSCDHRFKESDLRQDRVIRHKIKRFQERNRLAEDGDDDEFDGGGGRSRPFSVFDDGSRLSTSNKLSTAPVIKPEPRSSVAPRTIHNTPGPSVTGLEVDDEMDEDYDEN